MARGVRGEEEEEDVGDGRVDPAEHRGPDIGILDRLFRLPVDRRDNDHRGPRRIDPPWHDPPWRREGQRR